MFHEFVSTAYSVMTTCLVYYVYFHHGYKIVDPVEAGAFFTRLLSLALDGERSEVWE